MGLFQNDPMAPKVKFTFALYVATTIVVITFSNVPSLVVSPLMPLTPPASGFLLKCVYSCILLIVLEVCNVRSTNRKL